MDEERYRKAVEAANVWKQAGKHWEHKTSPIANADELVQDAPAKLAHKVGELIAVAGNLQVAWDTLNLIAQRKLRAAEPLPPNLAAWIADVIEDSPKPKSEHKRPRPRKGGDSKGPRNLLIQLAVANIADTLNLPHTRGGSGEAGKDGRSACDAVGQAFGLGYKTVEDVWNERHFERLNSQSLPAGSRGTNRNT